MIGLLLGTSFNTQAQEITAKRYVMMELFTNTFCGLCGIYDPAASATLDANLDNVHNITYYPNVPYPQCTFQQANPTDNNTRKSFYGVTGTPRSFTMGTDQNSGNSLFTQSTVDTHKGQDSPLRIAVDISGSGSMKSADVTLKSYDTPPSGDLRLFVAAVVKDVNFNAPNGIDDHSNVLWNILSSENGDPITLPSEGNEMTVTYNYNTSNITSAHPDFSANQVYIVAFVQNYATKAMINSGTSEDIILEIDACNPNMGTNDGSINVIASGGNGSYTYSWSNGMNMANLSNLSTGTYTLTVTDGVHEVYSTITLDNNTLNPGIDGSVDACPYQDVVFNLYDFLGGNPSPGGTWTDPNGNPSNGQYVNDSDPGGVYTYTVGSGACAFSSQVVVNYGALPSGLSISGVPSSPVSNGVPLSLSGTPAGGTFTGNGVVFNAFNPSIAGPGIHTITYTVSNECGSSAVSDDIFVITISYNFVNYNLGTISPAKAGPVEIILDAIESGNFNLQVNDISGRIIFEQQLDVLEGRQKITLNDLNLESGTYIVNIYNDDQSVVKKLIMN